MILICSKHKWIGWSSTADIILGLKHWDIVDLTVTPKILCFTHRSTYQQIGFMRRCHMVNPNANLCRMSLSCSLEKKQHILLSFSLFHVDPLDKQCCCEPLQNSLSQELNVSLCFGICKSHTFIFIWKKKLVMEKTMINMQSVCMSVWERSCIVVHLTLSLLCLPLRPEEYIYMGTINYFLSMKWNVTDVNNSQWMTEQESYPERFMWKIEWVLVLSALYKRTIHGQEKNAFNSIKCS